MDVSENSGTPKSSILIGFSIINPPFWGTPIFGNTLMASFEPLCPPKRLKKKNIQGPGDWATWTRSDWFIHSLDIKKRNVKEKQYNKSHTNQTKKYTNVFYKIHIP